MRNNCKALALIVLFITIPVQDEAYWTDHIQRNHLNDTKTNVVLWDRTRPDLMGVKSVYEVDWSRKWKEGVGQSSYYAATTGKQGVLILLFPNGIDSEKERLNGYRAMLASKHSNIKLMFFNCKQKQFIE